MIQTLYIICHGQSESSLQGIVSGGIDTSLTEKGREDAKKAAEKITKEVDVLFYSPLKRAKETGGIIAKELGIENVQEAEDLRERFYGDIEGLTSAEAAPLITKYFPTKGKNWKIEAPNIESYPAVINRIKDFMEWLQERHSGQVVALSTHEDMGQMLRAVMEGLTWEEALELPPMQNGEVLEYEL